MALHSALQFADASFEGTDTVFESSDVHLVDSVLGVMILLGHSHEVLKAVVLAVAIEMMDFELFRNRAMSLFPDVAMLHDVPPIHSDLPIASVMESAPTLP